MTCPLCGHPEQRTSNFGTRYRGREFRYAECVACGSPLNGSAAYFHLLADGLLCINDKRLASSELSQESRKLAAEMFRAPVERFTASEWPKTRAADLRRFLVQTLERHIEKKLVTAGMLEKISS